MVEQTGCENLSLLLGSSCLLPPSCLRNREREVFSSWLTASGPFPPPLNTLPGLAMCSARTLQNILISVIIVKRIHVIHLPVKFDTLLVVN